MHEGAKTKAHCAISTGQKLTEGTPERSKSWQERRKTKRERERKVERYMRSLINIFFIVIVFPESDGMKDVL